MNKQFYSANLKRQITALAPSAAHGPSGKSPCRGRPCVRLRTGALHVQRSLPGFPTQCACPAGVHQGLPKWSEAAQSCPTPCDPMAFSPPGSSLSGIFPGKNTGVVCHFLLQGIFPTQGSNPGLPHSRQTLYPLSRQGILGGSAQEELKCILKNRPQSPRSLFSWS